MKEDRIKVMYDNWLDEQKETEEFLNSGMIPGLLIWKAAYKIGFCNGLLTKDLEIHKL